MITQKLDLNLIHGAVLPRVNVSQYDSGSRTLELAVYQNTTRFTLLATMSVFIQGTKPDNHGFQYAGTIDTVNNIVTFDVTEQMTAVFGDVVIELVILDDDDNRIATGNFIMAVEKAALSDTTIISDTELPLIEEAAELAQQISGIVAEVEQCASDAEAWAVGERDGVPVTVGDDTYQNNSKYYAGQAATSAASVGDAEAYAVGTRGGVPVSSGDVAYHNNSKYYAGEASTSATNAGTSETNAGTSAQNAEAYAVGTRNGTAVTSGDVAYQNNAKYYAGEAATSETNAGISETNAGTSESNAEAWAVGERGGVPVSSGDPAYNNNAYYWAQQASGAVSDMVGATALTAGVHGLVPAPAAGDQNKFLKGDGTWDNAGGGGSTSLSGLTDTNISTPTDGQLLKYDNNSSKWVNGSTSLSALSDTTIATPTDGQVLAYDNNSSVWKNKSLGTAAAKNSTNAVTQSSTDLVESGAVYSALTPLSATLAAGATSVTIQNARITTSSAILPVAETYGLAPTNITVTTGQAVLTFEAQSSAENVGILVF